MDSTIIIIVGLIVSLISIVTPIIKLNNNLTRLNVTIVRLTNSLEEVLITTKNHEKRITYLEHNWNSGDANGNNNS